MRIQKNRRMGAESLETRAMLSATLGGAARTQKLEWHGQMVDVAAGSWIVGLNDTAGTPSQVAAVVQNRLEMLGNNGPKVSLDHVLVGGRAFELTTSADVTWQQLQNTVSRLPGFRYLEPNFVYNTAALPNDPDFPQLYGMNNAGQTGGTTDADIDAPEAWNITTGSSSVVVGVIDSGIDYTHPDLQDNIWTNPGEIAGNNIDDDGNGFTDDVHGWDFANDDSDPFDDNEHGTHVSGTIGAVGNNGVGVAGVAWDVQIMGLKFLDAAGFGSLDDAVDAINYATMMNQRGINIRATNNSWGGGGFSQTLSDAIQASGDEGMLFIAAAGNDSNNNDAFPSYPAGYNLDNVISVAATDRNDNIADFSNFGATSVDLAAPGVSILSTTPGNTYSSFDGTSMATPHVTGVAALAFSVAPTATFQQVKSAILGNVDVKPQLTGLVATRGRLNAQRTVSFLNANGPAVTSSAPAGEITGPVSSIDFQFSEPMNPASFSVASDVTRFAGPSGTNMIPSITGFSWVNSTTLRVQFVPSSAYGTYSMTIGPNILAAVDGNAMNQDRDALLGEATADQYTATFSLPPVAQYAFTPTPFEIIDLEPGQPDVFVILDGRDDASAPLDLAGRMFNFYGKSYSGNAQLFVSSNGLISFGEPNSVDVNSDFAGDPSSPSIAPLWDDWRTDLDSADVVLGRFDGDRLIIEWSQVQHFSTSPSTVTFQAILQLNTGTRPGDIIFNYVDADSGDITANGAGATIGIKPENGSLQSPVVVSVDAMNPLVGNGTAILFSATDPPIHYATISQPYEAIDLEQGQPGVFSIADDVEDLPLALGLGNNTFNYFGATFSGNDQLFVSPNGEILFGGDAAFNGATIRPLGNDWRTDLDSFDQVLGRFDGDRLIIEWSQVQRYPSSPSTATFQAILQLNTGNTPGDVIFNYVDLDTGNPFSTGGNNAAVTVSPSFGSSSAGTFISGEFNLSPLVATGKAIRLSVQPDIRMVSVRTGFFADEIEVVYEIGGLTPADPFNLQIAQSVDTSLNAGDTVLATIAITDPLDRTPGIHVLTFTPDELNLPTAGVTAVDFNILVVADPSQAVSEFDVDPLNEDNTAVFRGAYVRGGQLHVHGTAGDDVVSVDSSFGVVEMNNDVTFFDQESITRTIVYAHAGNDRITTRTGSSPILLQGGTGDDTYSFDFLAVVAGAVTVNEAAGAGNDTIDFSNSFSGVQFNLALTTVQTVNGVPLQLSSGTTFENVLGGFGDDTLTGNTVANRIMGGSGSDTMTGGAGNDVYLFDALSEFGTDTLNESGGGTDEVNFSPTEFPFDVSLNLGLATVQQVAPGLSLILSSASTFENAVGGAGNDVLTGNALNNRLSGGVGNDQLIGLGGNDTYAFDTDNVLDTDTIVDSAGVDLLDFTETTSRSIAANLGAAGLQVVNENLSLLISPGTAIENATGGAWHDVLIGSDAINTLTGGGGNDVLDGGAGNDSLVGGVGDDTYRFDTDTALGSDTLTETSGLDTLDFSASSNSVAANLGLATVQAVNVNLSIRLTSASAFENATGGTANDTLIGNTLGNRLAGSAGNDSLLGTSGNDVYVFDADSALGTDTLTDTAGVDTLEFADTSLNTSVDLSRAAVQVVNANLSLVLGSGTAFENVTGGSGNDTYLGNALGNIIRGSGGNDSLTSGAGNDQLIGGLGDDSYVFDADSTLGSDSLTEFVDQGTDTLDFSATAASVKASLSLAAAQIVVPGKLTVTLNAVDTFENIVGGSGNDTLIGNELTNRFTGGAGNDSLSDQYDDDSDVFSFDADTPLGADTIADGFFGFGLLDFAATSAAVTVNLGTVGVNQVVNANLSLQIVDVFPFSVAAVTGGTGADTLTGSDFTNLLAGGAGNDTLTGGDGYDYYLFDTDSSQGTDTIIDGNWNVLDFSRSSNGVTVNLAGAGTQTVNTNLSLNFQNPVIQFDVTGGDGNDTITGNTFGSFLHGLGGNDTIIGGTGDELIGGESGNDVLTGGAGNDTYDFGFGDSPQGADVLNEAGGGIDTLDFSGRSDGLTVNLGLAATQVVSSAISITLSSATTFENAFGGFGNDTITGNGIANRLSSGGAGMDVLSGLGGNDTYEIDTDTFFFLFAGEPGQIPDPGLVTLNDSAGTDTVDFTNYSYFVSPFFQEFTVDLASTAVQGQEMFRGFKLASATAFENVNTGRASTTVFGNSLANQFIDGSGSAFYNGRGGNDSYVFDFDLFLGLNFITDDAGTDTIDLSPSTAGGFVNLLQFPTVENIIGGAGDDLLIGNTQSNVIRGGSGNDVIVGAEGNDTLQGEAGNDIYEFDPAFAEGTDTITETTGIDTIDLSSATSAVRVNLALTTTQVVHANLSLILTSGVTLENVIGGSGNDTLTGNGLANGLTGGPGNDTMTGAAGNDTYYFAADELLGSDVLNESGGGTDQLNFADTFFNGINLNLGQAAAQPVNGNLTLTLGSASTFEQVVGTQDDDNLLGNAAANLLDGQDGFDVLTGHSGNDRLVGGDGGAAYIFDTDGLLGSDTIDGIGGGFDVLDFSQTTTKTIVVDLSKTTLQVVNSNLSLTFLQGDTMGGAVGGSLNDSLTGNSIDNLFVGNAGNDTMIGGAGTDEFMFDTDSALGSDTVSALGGGMDILNFSETATKFVTVNLNTTGASQVVNSSLSLNLLAGSYFGLVVGGDAGNLLTGDNGVNILVGGDGNDTLIGGGGRDFLIGGLGQDSLFGDGGEDILIGSVFIPAEFNDGFYLFAIMEEWTRTDIGYAERVSNLRNGAGMFGDIFVDSDLVLSERDWLDDPLAPEIDTLFGGEDNDWFWLFGGDIVGDGEIRN